MGGGANGWDKDFGMSGSFLYNGKITNKGKTSNIKGIGTMNVDAIACKNDCVPLLNGSLSLAQEYTDNLRISPDNKIFSVYPVPAHRQITIVPGIISSGKFTIKIYDATGRLKKQEMMNTVNGSIAFSVNGLAAGIYILQLSSPSGETFNKKIAIE